MWNYAQSPVFFIIIMARRRPSPSSWAVALLWLPAERLSVCALEENLNISQIVRGGVLDIGEANHKRLRRDLMITEAMPQAKTA